MQQQLVSLSEAKALIEQGKTLLLAGEETALSQLPKGSWIGGTIPYFIGSEEGGVVSREKVFATDLTSLLSGFVIRQYGPDDLASVHEDGPENGFSYIVIPAMSKAHLSFAMKSPQYEGFGTTPLIGWISGVHLDDLGKKTPKIFNGQTGAVLEEGALVLQASLPAGKAVEVGIINLFEQGGGDVLTFENDGFAAKEVLVNGEKKNFAAYVLEKKLDTKLPLVADYYGAMINTSFQNVDADSGEVALYAPVFKGIQYKHAKPVENYTAAFQKMLEGSCAVKKDDVVFSCNCILNYLYSELEGKKTEPFSGPITFGEIAYQLLNQTLVYLEVHSV